MNLLVTSLRTCQIWTSTFEWCALFFYNSSPPAGLIVLMQYCTFLSFILPYRCKAVVSSEWYISALFLMSLTAAVSWMTSHLVCPKSKGTNLIFPTSKASLSAPLHLSAWTAWVPVSGSCALLTIETGYQHDFQIKRACSSSSAPILTFSPTASCISSDVNVSRKPLVSFIL